MTYDEMKEQLLAQLTELDLKIKAIRALVDGWHPGLAPSAAWTEMPPAERIVLADGSIVTVADGHLMLDGAPMGNTSNVTLTYVDDKNAIRQTSTDTPGYWWLWTPPGWVATPDTRPGTAPPPVTDTKIKARILNWLKSLPRNKFISAQMTHADFREYDEMYRQLGVRPGMVGVDPWMDSSPSYNGGFVQRAIRHWDDGGIVQMSCFFPNPAGGGASSSGNATEILKVGSTQYNNLMRSFDQAAGPLQAFKDHGMAIIFRPFLEMDGGWFWWGRSSFNAIQFNELWRLLHRHYTVTKGFDHLLWTFAVNGGPLQYNFVGEDVVDICGIDGYTDNPDSQGYTNLYNRLRQEAPNLLVSWAEFGSGSP